MPQLDIVVFDETGTLTEGGETRVSDALKILLSSVPEKTLPGIVEELEPASFYPLANAIWQYASKHGAASVTGSSFDEIAGKGVKADLDSMRRKAIIGNEALMRDHDVLLSPDVLQMLERWKSEAKSIVLLVVVDTDFSDQFVVAAIFAVSDPIQREAIGVIRHLQEQGIGQQSRNLWWVHSNSETSSRLRNYFKSPDRQDALRVILHELDGVPHLDNDELKDAKDRAVILELTNRFARVREADERARWVQAKCGVLAILRVHPAQDLVESLMRPVSDVDELRWETILAEMDNEPTSQRMPSTTAGESAYRLEDI
ncbi:hypothetical protein EDB19DRAFT_1971500 [Suillus lakei]|nr:hypothetical protein EDB19DRAFT_1971500 [Suillus lakei]